MDLQAREPYRIPAVLQAISPRAYWLIAEGFTPPPDALRRAVDTFEGHIAPRVQEVVGGTWPPGINGDPRLTILYGPLRGAAGYYSAADEYPSVVHPYSNQRRMLYLNSRVLSMGTEAFAMVLAHELQHAFHYTADPTEETWVNEGLAELATELAGYPSSIAREFARRPSTSLTEWPEEPSAAIPNYGAALLFFRYLFQHYGGKGAIPLLVHEPADGIAGVEAFLARIGAGKTFLQVFKDWAVANGLGREGDAPPFYREGAPRLSLPSAIGPGQREQGTLSPFAAAYVPIAATPGAPLRLSFRGDPTTSLAPSPFPSGEGCWFSNRGDAIASRLTRAIDLTGVSQATLRFRLWYDIEEGWDYLYASVSTDGGRSWETLRGRYTTARNPLGTAFGHGWTGASHGWVEEEIDLTPYAGRRVLLRFEYVTDEAINLGGACVDDLAIPEVGWRDNALGNRGWEAEGWVRIPPRVPVQWGVRLVMERREGRPLVEDLPVDAQGRGEWVLQTPPDLTRALLVVLNTTPLVRRPAAWQVEVGGQTSPQEKGGTRVTGGPGARR